MIRRLATSFRTTAPGVAAGWLFGTFIIPAAARRLPHPLPIAWQYTADAWHHTLSITAINVNGADPADFAQTNNCGATLAVGASCAISITFTPTATGSRSAHLRVYDNGGGSPQIVGWHRNIEQVQSRALTRGSG